MARQPAQSDKQLSRRIMVIVNRDPMLKTPVVIWEHEKPILEEIHGEGKVEQIDVKAMDEGFTPKVRADLLVHNKIQDDIGRPSEQQGIGFVFTGNAEAEYDRMVAVYGQHINDAGQMSGMTNVEKIYGRPQDLRFSRLVGSPELSDLPAAQLRNLCLAYGFAPMPHKDATAEEKREAQAARKELSQMPGERLVELAAELGVEVG